MVVIFTDLFATARHDRGAACVYLRHKRHEVVLFHVLDETEMSFPFEDNTKFMKGSRRCPTSSPSPGTLREGYLGGAQRVPRRRSVACCTAMTASIT